MTPTATPGNSEAQAEQARGLSRRRLRRLLGAGLSVTVFSVALWVLHREISHLRPDAIIAHARSIPWTSLLKAAVFTTCGYLVLTAYDALGMRYIGQSLSYRHTARTAFMAFAVAHNVGIAALSGGSIRYRMYSLLGLSGLQIAGIIVFSSATFALGSSLLLGLALLLMPPAETGILGLPPAILDAVGIALLAVPVVYLVMTRLVRAPIGFGKWTLKLPSTGIGLTQVLVSVADLTFAATTLYVLLASNLPIGFLPFLGIYLIALSAGLLSSVPGGIGVFEAVLLLALPDMDRSVLLGTVIVYRAIYYLLPLFLALLLLAGNELLQHRRLLGSSAQVAGQWLSATAPPLIGLAVFLAGVVLLISGSTPAVQARLDMIARFVPLPLLEASHLAGSVAGIGLLVLARGLFRRLHSAYVFALGLLVAGVAFSLIKGLDFEEALMLLAVLGFLWLSRDEFYRRGSVAMQEFSPGWVAAIVLALCFAIWIGLISFRHVPYSQELWWQFAFHSDAPRMLRASLVAGLALMSLALGKLLRTGRLTPPPEPSPPDMDRVRTALREARYASANAALMGDKRFLWSPDGQAFIMYRRSGSHWIALGDPVGPEGAREELAWSFRELVDRYDGRPVFYQVSDDSLPLYVDMGLTLGKLGEEAWVPLESFSLDGSKYAEFRRTVNKTRKLGAEFSVVPGPQLEAIAPDLRAVSDAWLEDKSGSEKGFSLGAFSVPYLANFDCAVVRMEGSVVAFANLWPAPASGELSVDLMRYNQSAPKGIMDYLFAELLLWSKQRDFKWFNLGMAPLSGLERHELAPLWHKLGHLVFSHGEAFYHFEGLRRYKEKFHPEWRPRYVACPGGQLGLPLAMLEVSRLISGGVGGMLHK